MATIEQFLTLVARLRDPKTGCPWDIAQNFDTMLPCLLEESYEVAEAIHTQDRTALREELGDLLLQVVFLSQLAKEEGTFCFQDVLNDIHEKLIFRHPHVFGEQSAQNSEEALQNWEAQKAREKAAKGKQSILEDIPFALPALTRAHKLQKRAAKVGFDWRNPADVLAKVDEELDEVKVELAQNPVEHEKLAEELGDLLFITVNLCRHHKIDAETSLRNANVKFEKRFRYIENTLKLKGKTVAESDDDTLNSLWDEIKTLEKIDKIR